MRDHQHGAVTHKSSERLPDARLAVRIKAGCWLVQDQDRCVFQDGTGDSDALRLPSAELHRLLAYLGVETARQFVDEGRHSRQRRRVRDLVITGFRPGQADVLAHRAVEEIGPLRNEGYVLPPPM